MTAPLDPRTRLATAADTLARIATWAIDGIRMGAL